MYVMRRTFTIICILFSLNTLAQEPLIDKVIFANSPMAGNYFYSETSYTAPSWIKNTEGKIPVATENFTPGNALELEYVSAPNGHWQATVLYRQLRGMDMYKPVTHLVFRLYLDSDVTPDLLPLVGISDLKGKPELFLQTQNFTSELLKSQWHKVSIPLRDFGALKVEDINAVHFKQQGQDGKTHRLLIDQIELIIDKAEEPIHEIPKLLSAVGYARHTDISWAPISSKNVKYVKIYRSTDNKTFEAVDIQNSRIGRYADYTGQTDRQYYYQISFLGPDYKESAVSNKLSAKTRSMSDEELLDMVQQAHFRYYWEGAEPNSGLALENIPGRQNMVALGASGFGIMSILVGAERNFITRQQAVERFLKITSFLKNADTFHGAFSHFVDGPTGKVVPFFGHQDNGGDLVETSFLIQGLLAAQQYFDKTTAEEKLIRDRIQKIWEGVEWSWYRRYPDSDFLYWHWSPDQEWTIDHKLIGWNETMITYLLAIASPTHPVPASLYYSGWASQSEEAQAYRTNWGQTDHGSMYTNGNTYFGIPLKVGVSTGGPLFFIHYSYLGPNPRMIKDAYSDYFTNNRNIALINYRYCQENPGKFKGYGPFGGGWGLTASDGPWNYSADEPALHMDKGKLTPTGALASFPYTPEESMAALKAYYYDHGHFLWGAYGFKDAFILEENWRSNIYMGLNQAPIIVMIENFRSGLIWDLFMKNPDVKKALEEIQLYKP